MCSVESIEPQAVLCEFIEIRRLEFRVTVVSGIAPALIISHDEDDVGPLCWRTGLERSPRQEQQSGESENRELHDDTLCIRRCVCRRGLRLFQPDFVHRMVLCGCKLFDVLALV